ncbi:MAG TPA: UDP-N-acetylmuramate dehydrogenase [Bacteroidales bacterium]|nr:UDP-N-acetylmuramate dehydrogenase [Bacteroidales bacterium]HPT22417.1 UDP-N-acetylmuramate dehydrogenase [Bacteroidales bacterium]
MIYKNISLKKYNTFGFDYKADNLVTIKDEDEAVGILKNGKDLKHPLFIIGGGSNLLFTEDFKGTLIHSEIEGINTDYQKNDYVIVSSGSGVIWDDFVEWCVNKGYGGIENLSFIPGSVGASPVQNIGAYGIEAKDIIEKVRAVSVSDGSVSEFTNKECRFGYRNSIFKEELKNKFLVTRVYFRLSTNPILRLDYGSLTDEISKLGGANIRNVRQAVVNIRRSKLPDPEVLGNAGSFFKNPLVEKDFANALRKQYPGMPCYDDPSGKIKLAAGWLVDRCEWKGKRTGDAGVHDKQALVLVNYGGASGNEIYNLSEKIKKSVSDKFGIVLEREVEVVGSI